MKIQTFSILVGNKSCNAQCPYCIADMTPKSGIDLKVIKINWRNFDIGCKLAKQNGVSTILITSKGEPTLFPKEIEEYLIRLNPYDFPFIELQTNGIVLFQKWNFYKSLLQEWYDLGMTTIAISLVHYQDGKNKQIFQPNGKHINLIDAIKKFHLIGFSIRLSIIMIKGYIDNVEEIKNLVQFAKDNNVEQLTIRPVEQPNNSADKQVSDWVAKHQLDKIQMEKIRNFFKEEGTELMKLVHGAMIYDLYGQNICLTNALTIDSRSEDVRQLIFFPDGHLRYDWQYTGAILL